MIVPRITGCASPAHFRYARGVGKRAVLAAALGIACAGACTSLDGLQGGGNDDAGSDAAVADAIIESTPPLDASDAGREACAIFCDEFDDRTDPLGKWDSVDGPNVSIVTDLARSPPSSLLVTTAQGTTNVAVGVTKNVPVLPVLHFVFDVYIDADPGGFGSTDSSYEEIIAISSPDDIVRFNISLTGGGDGAAFDFRAPGNGRFRQQSTFLLKRLAWHHISLVMTLDVAGKMTLLIDEVLVADVRGDTSVPGATQLLVALEAQTAGVHPSSAIHYDNFAVY
jgi:hypothetical protein